MNGFILNKYYRRSVGAQYSETNDELKLMQIMFSIDSDLGCNIGYKYLLKEDEENKITELLRKFDLYDQIRFIDGVAYNITVKGGGTGGRFMYVRNMIMRGQFEEPEHIERVTLNYLEGLEFEEVTENYAYDGNIATDLDMPRIPYNNQHYTDCEQLTMEKVMKFILPEVFDHLI